MLAHSARPKLGIPAQGYPEHVSAVVAEACANARRAVAFWRGDGTFLRELIENAALVHDLGKLDTDNQKILGSTGKSGLPWAHEDAGTKHLLDLHQIEAALLVASHHAGLPDVPAEENKGDNYGRKDKLGLWERTGSYLSQYLRDQQRSLPQSVLPRPAGMGRFQWSSLARRIALSCLVDSDHGDTARHYRNESEATPPPTRWAERLNALDRYVTTLPRDRVDPERAKVRELVYRACRDLLSPGSMHACDAGVGTGKTTAVMAHCLRLADEFQLRHVIVVLPYTNIIQQSVKTYREALCLGGEDPEQVIAEHHHQADFQKAESRQLATLWNCPVTVTTAVQFFETIASNSTGRLRKLHELPGSAIFIDEAHAAIPTWLWRQTWKWLREMCDDWGCHIVLASGSLARFWEVRGVVEKTTTIPDMISDELRVRVHAGEQQRVRIQSHPEPLDLKGIIDFIQARTSPRLVILNTVQSAAVVADTMRAKSLEVMHLSTVLTPTDRNRIIAQVKERIPSSDDWTLVATSCIEAGVDLSFASAIRESATTASLIQTSGRVNRHSSLGPCEVWDVRLSDPLFNKHPAFEDSRKVLRYLFEHDYIGRLSPDKLITKAMEMEAALYVNNKACELCKYESKLNFPEVASRYQVIDSATLTVVVDPECAEALRFGRRIPPSDLVRNSVQLWSQRVRDLEVPLIEGHNELYRWDRPYDAKLLGYMVSVLPMIYAKRDSFYMI